MKKGFTLIELIATLVILSIVAIIVVPNIDKNFKKMVKGVTDVQKEAIIEASKNWANDNINSMPSVNDGVVYVYLKELKDGGYLSENVYKNTDLTEYNDNIFIEITCKVIESDQNNNINYKYSYNLYDTNEKLLIFLATKYAKNNTISSTTVLSVPTLLQYLPNELVDLKVENKLKSIEETGLISNSTVTIENKNGIYNYIVQQ